MDANLHPRDEVSYDAADPVQVRQRQLAAKRREKDDRDTIVALLGTPNGRRWFADLLASCHIYSTSFDHDATVMAFREGERNVGLRLLSLASAASPDAILTMMKERSDG